MIEEIIHGLNSYFTFRLGAELFAVNIGRVTKILGLAEITKVPNSPKELKGIINLFGDVLPVFDGRLKFGFPETESTRNTCIVVFVFEFVGQTVTSGIIVDSVEKVMTFEPDQIKPAPNAGESFSSKFIDGVVTLNGEFAFILNIEKIFSEEEISWVSAVE
jgi:purine-binding chemotaxis protein CheW